MPINDTSYQIKNKILFIITDKIIDRLNWTLIFKTDITIF